MVKTVVIGTSYGGMQALKTILTALPEDFSIPILIVQHLGRHSEDYLAQYLNNLCKIVVKEAEEKEQIQTGYAYLAPSNYHMMIDKKGYISLDVDEKVNYSRPSIDVLFESAVDAFGSKVIGIILTGASSDGSKGLKRIKDCGGLTIVQDPSNAEADTMPNAAINLTQVDYILPLNEISNLLNELVLGEK